jgi:ATP-dependent RNA helicase DDX5/DBP2
VYPAHATPRPLLVACTVTHSQSHRSPHPLVQHIPQQGRQTLFYTATWPKEVRRLASEFLTSPCIVYIGDTDKLVANKDITQTIIVLGSGGMREKDTQTRQILRKYPGERCVLVLTLVSRVRGWMDTPLSTQPS